MDAGVTISAYMNAQHSLDNTNNRSEEKKGQEDKRTGEIENRHKNQKACRSVGAVIDSAKSAIHSRVAASQSRARPPPTYTHIATDHQTDKTTTKRQKEDARGLINKKIISLLPTGVEPVTLR